jgi:hypothetical protein
LTLAFNELAAFFSYSRADSSFVVQLAADLKAAGANVWLDQLDITPGQRWDSAIEDALKICPRLIVILSPTSVNSTNVMDEVSFALEEQKTVIPVIYTDCAIPFRLRRLQHVDFKHDYGHGLKELLNVLAPRQKPEPSAPAISDVRDVPEMKKGRNLAEPAQVQAARTQAAAHESSDSFLSRYPGGAKAVAAVFAVLIVGIIFYWKFLPSPTKKQAQDVPRPTTLAESTNPQPAVREQPEPLRQPDQGQPIRTVPSEKRANPEKSEAGSASA